jgi:large subunit ribosomal protein L32
MALQKRRLGRARIHHRRSSWMRRSGTKATIQECPNCGEARVPHRVCMKCGFYRGDVRMKTAAAAVEE